MSGGEKVPNEEAAFLMPWDVEKGVGEAVEGAALGVDGASVWPATVEGQDLDEALLTETLA